MIFHIVAQVKYAQSWTALFRAFSSHRQPSALIGFPGVDHEGRQDFAVLISMVTQRGVLAVGIAYGCPYYKDLVIFHLFLKYHK